MANVLTGFLYKKTFNANGAVKEKAPFLLRTWAGIVFMSDGKSVQETIEAQATSISNLQNSINGINTNIEVLENKKSYLTFNTKDEYLAAYTNGDIPPNVLAVIGDVIPETEPTE